MKKSICEKNVDKLGICEILTQFRRRPLNVGLLQSTPLNLLLKNSSNRYNAAALLKIDFFNFPNFAKFHLGQKGAANPGSRKDTAIGIE